MATATSFKTFFFQSFLFFFKVLKRYLQNVIILFFKGVCGYSNASELATEVGGQFGPERIGEAKAFATFLGVAQPHVLLSLEGGGVFVR